MFLFGITEVSWLALLSVLVMTSWRLGGVRLAIGVFAGLVFLLVSSAWDKTMLSFWLCGIAVVISFLFGSSLGIWAAHNDHVSRIMRPVNDTLQTMPLFVILIPIVMVFKIGEFTALLAIMAYSYVPAFRYAEHGLKKRFARRGGSCPVDGMHARTALVAGETAACAPEHHARTQSDDHVRNRDARDCGPWSEPTAWGNRSISD